MLLGAGHAHLQVLMQLAAQPLPGTVVTLITPHPRQMVASMVPGFVAGHYRLEDCVIPLEPLVQRSGIRWLQRSVTAVNAQAQTIQLDDGSTVAFDWLSVNTDPVQDRERIEHDMPGAREYALFIRPVEAFAALWPRVAEMGDARPRASPWWAQAPAAWKWRWPCATDCPTAPSPWSAAPSLRGPTTHLPCSSVCRPSSNSATSPFCRMWLWACGPIPCNWAVGPTWPATCRCWPPARRRHSGCHKRPGLG